VEEEDGGIVFEDEEGETTMSSWSRRVAMPKVLTPKEQASILKVTLEHARGYRDHMIISTALGTALREHEIEALDCGDVVHQGKIRTSVELRVYKDMRRKRASKRSSRITPQVAYLPKVLRHKLARYMTWKRRRGEKTTPEAPLFMSSRGQRISNRMIRHLFREWQKKAKFETLYPFHALRHTAVSNMYRRGGKDLRATQIFARHGQSTTTEIYTHVDDDLRQAIEDMPC
jgi:integrase/recombinase XerC